MPAVLTLILGIFLLNDAGFSKKKSTHKRESGQVDGGSAQKSAVSAFISLQLTDDAEYTSEKILSFIQLLQDEESKTIHRHTGIHSLTSRIESYCRQMVMHNNPNSFNEVLFMSCFEETVKASFPERLEQIVQYLRNLLQYRSFLEFQSNSGNYKNKKEQEDALWQKRQELFGFDAVEELYAGERYIKNMEQKIAKSSSGRKSLDEKIRSFEEEIANIKASRPNPQEGETDEFIQFGEIFLSSPEVQSSLRSMSADQRNRKMREIRRSAGIPEERLNQLEEWDRNSFSLWEKGQQYLKEAGALKEKSDLSQEEYSQELKKLKESYFGKETADEIEEEEKRGISRFSQKPEFMLQ